MITRRRFITRCAAPLAALSLPLGGCSNSASFRYKLTLALETPTGIKTGSSVVEINVYDVSFPASGTSGHATGEAVFVDLGPGQRPLVAIMTLHRPKSPRQLAWGEGMPDTKELLIRYGATEVPLNQVEQVKVLRTKRGPRELTDDDLPDLVTFAGAAVPSSVLRVDPYALSATLGPGVRWHKMTIEITDEKMTHAIEQKLPWLIGFEGSLANPGRRGGVRTSNDLAATLGLINFKMRGR